MRANVDILRNITTILVYLVIVIYDHTKYDVNALKLSNLAGVFMAQKMYNLDKF